MTNVFDHELFTTVNVRIRFRDRVLGGIPKQESPLDYYITQSQMSDAEAKDFRDRVKDGELSDEEKESVKETNWCCFEKDHDGNLCFWHGNVKSMLKEAFAALGLCEPSTRGKQKLYKYAKQHNLQVAVHVEPLRPVFVNGDGEPMTEPDGAIDKVKHVKGPHGEKISALGRHDYLERPEMIFSLRWLKDGPFDMKDMEKAAQLSQDVGLGASRSQGFGKFDVLAFDVVKAKKKVIVDD